MLLQIFGLTRRPTWWHLNRIPANGGVELTARLNNAISETKEMEFFVGETPLVNYPAAALADLWSDTVGHLVAKPVDAAQSHHPEARLLLVTTQGPDSGRTFPLSRRNLAVGRNEARAQVFDPWLSAHHFDIRLSSNGPIIRSQQDRPFQRITDTTFAAGTTSFTLQRGAGDPLRVPEPPGAFEISPGQPPSPPNILLQIIGAAAPLMIGIVLMLMTGMWYFLLFSGISVIIALVLITQYRRARNRFAQKIHTALQTTSEHIRDSLFTPPQLMLAATSGTDDPMALSGPQPVNPIVHIGNGIRTAEMLNVQDAQRWNPHLSVRIEIALELVPGHRTVILGAPDAVRPVKNWCLAQLLRHIKATGTGLSLDGELIGGTTIVEMTSYGTQRPQPHIHQVIFTDDLNIVADKTTTVVNLDQRRVDASWTAQDIVVTGMSRASLDRLCHELGLDQPREHSTSEYLTISPHCMQEQAVTELVTAIGSGPLGLSIDLVADGPHLLITGTTGSGKSELLLTVLAGLSERYPPCEVSMILLDFKGGSSFNVLASLPHTMSVETNHVAASSLRSLKAIAAELFRREALFARYNAADYTAFRRLAPHVVLPRLIVAIDELRVLIEQYPEASVTLAHLAATGRSLGFHLVISTQRTHGAVNADIRANIGALITLRTATEHDSWDVLGTADAFSIPPTTPGRAYFKAGADKPRVFQTSRYVLDDEALVIMPYDSEQSVALRVTTDWPALVRQLQAHAAALPLPKPVILPALPQRITRASLNAPATNSDAYPIGLLDDPAKAQQYPVHLGPSTDTSDQLVLSHSVAWIGAAGSGIAEALMNLNHYVCRSATRRVFLDGRQRSDDHSQWHIYLQHSKANSERLHSFLTDLTTELARGTETTLVIADWGSWATALVTGSFQGFEDQLIQVMRQHSANLKVYVFGGRELAGGRLLGMIPDRFYLPKNSSAEHQMIWPKLLDVQPLRSRAVFVTAEQPNGGWEVQLVDDS